MAFCVPYARDPGASTPANPDLIHPFLLFIFLENRNGRV